MSLELQPNLNNIQAFNQVKQTQDLQKWDNGKQIKSMGVYGNTASITDDQTEYDKNHQQKNKQLNEAEQQHNNKKQQIYYTFAERLKGNLQQLREISKNLNQVDQLKHENSAGIQNQFQDINEESFKQNAYHLHPIETEGDEQKRQNQHVSEKNQKQKQKQKQDVSNDGKWRAYLHQAYKHYSKSSYATGICPTFDRIQKSANYMNINTFMSFCRNFGITLPRPRIIQIYKQANHFITTMAFPQFIHAMLIISLQLYSQFPSQQKNYECFAFQKMIKFLNMDNNHSFHSKMLQIQFSKRQHGLNAHQILVKPQPQSTYKFKINAHNGRCPQQVRDELFVIKQNKCQTKQEQKEQKQKKHQIQKYRFQNMNKIPFSLKKVSNGGYISPNSVRNPDMKLYNSKAQNKLQQSIANESVKLMDSFLNAQQDRANNKKINRKSKYDSYEAESKQSYGEQDRSSSYLKSAKEKIKMKYKDATGYLLSYKLKKYQVDKDKRKQQYKNLKLNTIIDQARNQNNYSKAESQIRRVYTLGDQRIQSGLSNQYGITVNQYKIKKSISIVPSTISKNKQTISSVSEADKTSEQIYFDELLHNAQEDYFLSQHLKMDEKKLKRSQYVK